jgi:hypothetical protein
MPPPLLLLQVPVVTGLRELAEALEAGGAPPPNSLRRRADGQLVADVFPCGLANTLLWGGCRGEVWLEPGKEATQVTLQGSGVPHGTGQYSAAGLPPPMPSQPGRPILPPSHPHTPGTPVSRAGCGAGGGWGRGAGAGRRQPAARGGPGCAAQAGGGRRGGAVQAQPGQRVPGALPGVGAGVGWCVCVCGGGGGELAV